MEVYELILTLPEIDDSTVDAIYGLCPDSSIGKTHGTMHVTFNRESTSLEAAIDSAIADLSRLGISPLSIEADVSPLD